MKSVILVLLLHTKVVLVTFQKAASKESTDSHQELRLKKGSNLKGKYLSQSVSTEIFSQKAEGENVVI